MDKVIEIRKAVTALLKDIHPRVYYEVADEKAPFPYLVCVLSTSAQIDETLETFRLEIDGWDEPQDGTTGALESLMTAADGQLHRAVIRRSELTMVLNRENRMVMTDDDKRIRRRKYIYQIRTYGG